MRYLPTVITQLLEVIPDKAEQCQLREDLERIKQSAKYTAPEIMSFKWSEVSAALSAVLPWPPVEDWHKSVAAIFSAKE